MFEKVIGHDIQKEKLKSMINQNNVFHAYLFSGQKGVGKSKLAIEFAKELLDTDNLEVCPDYKYITKEKDKKDISIEQIRKQIIEDIYILPASGDRKVYIIDEAQNLNKSSQNALLKTLEEPPKYINIILVASGVSSFLPTIISRVNILNFNKIKDEELEEYIKSKYDIKIDRNIIKYFDGSIGLALDFIENGELEKVKEIDKLYEQIVKKEYINTLQIAQNIDFTNEHMMSYLEYIFFKEEKYQIVKFIEKARTRLKYNGNYDIVIDTMLLRIIDNI